MSTILTVYFQPERDRKVTIGENFPCGLKSALEIKVSQSRGDIEVPLKLDLNSQKLFRAKQLITLSRIDTRANPALDSKFRDSVIDIDKRPRERNTVYGPIKETCFNRADRNVQRDTNCYSIIQGEWGFIRGEINVRFQRATTRLCVTSAQTHRCAPEAPVYL